MFKKHFKTLKSRIHLYIFTVASLVLCFQIVQASAYESLKLAKYNPQIVEYSMMIQIAAGRY